MSIFLIQLLRAFRSRGSRYACLAYFYFKDTRHFYKIRQADKIIILIKSFVFPALSLKDLFFYDIFQFGSISSLKILQQHTKKTVWLLFECFSKVCYF